MAKSHLESQQYGTPRLHGWARQTVAGMVLVASLSSLALILHNQYGSRVAGVLSGLSETMATGRQSDGLVVSGTENPAAQARHRALAEFLARRYKVSQDMMIGFVDAADAAARQAGLDPLLILAVMAVESRMNPIAESVAGAKGLMQIIPQYHPEKWLAWGGEKAAFDPEANIDVGAKILKEYLIRTRDMAEALQMYAGASDDPDNIYATKVFGEQQRLRQVVKQFNDRTVQVGSRPPIRVGASS